MAISISGSGSSVTIGWSFPASHQGFPLQGVNIQVYPIFNRSYRLPSGSLTLTGLSPGSYSVYAGAFYAIGIDLASRGSFTIPFGGDGGTPPVRPGPPAPGDPGDPDDPYEPPPSVPDPPTIDVTYDDVDHEINATVTGFASGWNRQVFIQRGDDSAQEWESPYNVADPSWGIKYTGYTRYISSDKTVASNFNSDSVTTPDGPPDAPTILRTTACFQRVVLTLREAPWDGGSDITGYEVGYTPAGGSETIASFGDSLTLAVTGLTTDVEYSIRVRAVNEHGGGYWSNTVMATPILPQRPGKAIPPTLERDGADINGTISPPDDRCDPILKYYYRIRGVGTATWSQVDLGNVTTFTLSGLVANVTYEVQVAAENKYGIGDWSASAVIVPLSKPSPPGIQHVYGWRIDSGNLAATEAIGNVALTSSLAQTSVDAATWHIDTMYIAFGKSLYSSKTPYDLDTFTSAGTLVNTPVSLYSDGTKLIAIAANGARENALTGTAEGTITGFTGSIVTSENFHGVLYIIAGTTMYSVEGNAATALSGTADVQALAVSDGLLYGASSTDTKLQILAPIGSTVTKTASTYNLLAGVSAMSASASPPSVSPRNNAAQISLLFPRYDGGANVTAFPYRFNPGNITGSTTTPAFQHTGLVNGTAYTFQAQATNSVGTSVYSEAASVTPANVTSPGAPTISNLTVGNGQLSIDIALPSDLGGLPFSFYKVYYRTKDVGIWASFFNLTSNATITGLTNGTEYEVYATTNTNYGEGAKSNTLTGTPAAVPNAPIISSVSVGSTSANLTCTVPDANGSAITGYDWNYKRKNSATWLSQTETSPSLALTGLVQNAGYDARVRAVNAIGNSSWSVQVSLYPAALPAKPTLAATVNGTDVTLVASHSETVPIQDYTFRYDTGAEFNPQASDTLTVTDLTIGQRYGFQVMIQTQRGESVWSDVVYATPVDDGESPVPPDLIAGDLQFTVAVDAPSGSVTGRDYRYRHEGDWAYSRNQKADFTVTGLVNGIQYEVETRNILTGGYSQWSNPSFATPFGAPRQPIFDAAVSGNSIALTNISSYGNGRMLNDFEVQWRLLGNSNWISHISGAFFDSHTITGLQLGTTYQVRVRVSNDLWSAWSGIATIVVRAVPDIPSITLANLDASLELTIIPATFTGGQNIIGYDYQYRIRGSETWASGASTSTTVTITGLLNGTAYQVRARTRVANGAESGWSDVRIGIPAGVPGAATVVATPASRSFVGRISRPSDNGSAIIEYEYEYRPVGSVWVRGAHNN